MRIWLLLLLMPMTAHGQDAIFKCVDAQGAIAYQNAPCPDGAKVADIREYERLTPQQVHQAQLDERQRLEASQQRQQQRRVVASSASQPQRPTEVQTKRQQCAAAKKARDQARKSAPMWRDVHYLEP